MIPPGASPAAPPAFIDTVSLDARRAVPTSSSSRWARVRRQSSSCLACTDPIAACNCSAGYSCYQTARTCTQCAQNLCRLDSSSGGKSSLGGTIGGAVGGILGVAAALGLLYWFWWKPRGLAASRKRYSKHVSARQSKMMGGGASEKAVASPPLHAHDDGVAKRSSVHLRMENGEGTLSHRPTTPGGSEEPSSAGATRGSYDVRPSSFPCAQLDNPFGDHARSSIGTSDFSFRSSRSTNIIPIAYIPPHSSSMAVEDASRGAYGELLSDSALAGSRRSIPTSMASRDSLALAGADEIIINPLPPVLSPDSPIIPINASTPGGAPIRPPRSPGLDLQLPKKANPTTSPLASPQGSANVTLRPLSSFPWSSASPSPGGTSLSPGATPSPPATSSRFSMATRRTSDNSYLSAPGSPRGLSVDGHGSTSQQHHLSTLSTISSSTNRSAGSTMSYILDPPQIITPVNAAGLRRVEVVGREQAGLVRIPGSSVSDTPPLPTPTSIDSTLSSPTTPKALSKQQATAPADEDPFADNARFSTGAMTSVPLGPTHARTTSEGTIKTEQGYATDLGFKSGDTSRWTNSSVGSAEPHLAVDILPPSPGGSDRASVNSNNFFDLPQSARNSRASGIETGAMSRPLTGASQWSAVGGEGGESMSRDDSRTSYTSNSSRTTDSMSMLDGIPFLPPTGSPGSPQPPRSSGFPLPPPRSPSMGPPSPALSAGASSYAPQSDHRNSAYSYDTAYSDASSSAPRQASAPQPQVDLMDLAADETTETLPAPFLPFAGQRPTSNVSAVSDGNASRVQSQAISVRSGFGSGLSQIPFQLGFPSGLDSGSDRGSMMGASERGSMMTMDSRHGGERDSMASYRPDDGEDEEDRGMLSGVEEQTEPGSRPESFQSATSSSRDSVMSMGDVQIITIGNGETTPLKHAPEDDEPAPEDETENPFEDPQAEVTEEIKEEPKEEVAAKRDSGVDSRDSTAMAIALSQELAQSLEGLADD
ncbi:membrane anchor Opy2, N-terminal domain containing protein [Pseudohyphozyma bogoriensis]|nr:membrane anchor Opy2, N-terminal domain containing protein [Pseudohyphozyma bogoriensis]